MQSKISTRWTLIVSTIILSIIFLSNDYSFYSSSSSEKAKKVLFDTNIINLGLDLQGGKEFLLAPKLEDWLVEKVNNSNVSSQMRADFDTALSEIDKKIKEDSKYVLTIDEFEKYLNNTETSISDLFNGITKDELKNSLDESLTNNIEIIHNRIDDKGVTEPSIRKIGSKISVEIPGKKNIDKLEELITSSARLTINEIASGPGTTSFVDWNNKVSELFNLKIDELGEWPKSIRNHITLLDPDFPIITIKEKDFINFKNEIKKIRRSDEWFKQLDFLYLDASSNYINQTLQQISALTEIPDIEEDRKFICLIESDPIITGDMIDKAYVSTNESVITDYRVNIELNDIGSSKFKKFTKENINKFAPIVLDGEILSMPSIPTVIPDGTCYIDGFKDIKEANYLATQLKFGKFNLALKKVYDKTVDASLGNQMITLGMFAFIIGISLVIVFMILYYKTAGLIASVSLILNILFMSSILSILGATLTLPGIAGFILTVGIAVDANVIIFERIKEEVRVGLPPLSAIESGYDRAFVSIIDANVTTLLTAIILYFFGSGPIKGFAITLSAGIVCSMFTAIYVTRTIFNTLYYSKVPKKLSI